MFLAVSIISVHPHYVLMGLRSDIIQERSAAQWKTLRTFLPGLRCYEPIFHLFAVVLG